MLWRVLGVRRRTLTLAAVLLVSGTVMTLGAHGGGRPGPIGNTVAVVAEPFQAGATGAVSFLSRVGDGLFSGGRLRRENEELRAEVSRLRREMQENRERIAAAARFERLLEYRQRSGFRVTVAGVIGQDASGLHRTILIDRGASDGLRVNQPVVSPDGVVGRIVRAYPRSALVLLLVDRSSGIDAIVQRTRDQGVVQGGDEACELKYLARQAEVEVGDRVVTSGHGGVFPKGVWIGEVTRVQKGGYLFQSVEVRPTAAIDRLEEVLVVTGLDREQEE